MQWRKLPGVLDVRCVYVGGQAEYPTYESIGDHTEGVTVVMDPKVMTYRKALDFFFASVSPYHGCSDKRQYASGVWWHNEAQRLEIERKEHHATPANHEM